MSNRRSFLKDVAMAISISLLPECLRPQEINQTVRITVTNPNKGLLAYLNEEHVATYTYRSGCLTLKDFDEISTLLQSSKNKANEH